MPFCIHQFPIHSYLLLYHNSSESPIWAVRDSRQQKITLTNPHHEKTHRLTCAHEGDSNQPAYLRSLISIFHAHVDILYPYPVKILIRLRECAVWSESSLGTLIRKYVFWRYGSYKWRYISDVVSHINEGTFSYVAAHINEGTFSDVEAHINEGTFSVVVAHINEGTFSVAVAHINEGTFLTLRLI